jgi:threonine aldolase
VVCYNLKSMANPIDLRSDTVTKPTPEMLQAMLAAPLGDDVFGDDPTVIALEEKMADLLGLEAGLFVPSGTMANEIAINVWTRPGDAVVCEHNSHIVRHESAGAAALSGVMFQTIHGEDGYITREQIEAEFSPEDPHVARITLISLENAHTMSGGRLFPYEELVKIARRRNPSSLPGERSDAVRVRGLGTEAGSAHLHLDGARLPNACIASHTKLADWGTLCDSVSVCLSKGLGAPVGSVLCGSKEFVHEARRVRKRFGGGMRQAGILAAAGIYALDNNYERLAEDHDNAKYFASELTALPGVKCNPQNVVTNSVVFEVAAGADSFCQQMAQSGVLLVSLDAKRVRAMTHLQVTKDDCRVALQRIADALK